MKLKMLQTKTAEHLHNISNNYMAVDILKTDDSFKYDMIRHNDQTYVSPVVTANILAIVDMNGIVVTDPDIKKHGLMVSLVLDKTCFYCEAGGQQNDIGVVKTNNGQIFNINNVEKIQENGVVLHYIKSSDWPMLLRYFLVFIIIDMINNKKTHLLILCFQRKRSNCSNRFRS